MTITQKLVLYALAVALLPLASSGFTLIRLGEDGMRARIEAHQRTATAAVAASIEQSINEIGERAVTALELTDPLRLSAAERLGLLRLLHRQATAIRASVFLDANGQLLVRPVTSAINADELSLTAANDAVKRLRDNLPAAWSESVNNGQVLLSPVYFPPSGPARLAMAVGCCANPEGKPLAAAGVELELTSDVLGGVDIETGANSRLFVVDRFGRVIAHPTLAVGTDLSQHAAIIRLKGGQNRGSLNHTEDNISWAASFARVANLGWGVVVEQPESVAFADARRMRMRMLTWISITTLVVALTALLFASRLRQRLLRLMQGARMFAVGRLGERVKVNSNDEISELAKTLNSMASELDHSLREIDAWGRTLETKVDDRTRELRQAQTQLLLQSKLAAIGQLGAGVAHEVNNPLAGILGYVQLLLRKFKAEDTEYTSLKRIEEAAQRCRTITTNLLRFSQRGLSGRNAIEVNELVEEVLELMGSGITESGIEIVRELAADAGAITVDAGQLALVLINLLSNAKNAMTEGGKITIHTRDLGDQAQITVSDTGHGIDPEHLSRIFDPFFTTKTNWTGVGLGLSVAYRIIADHGGRIEVESKINIGSQFIITLPRKPVAPVQETSTPQRPVLLA
ncbi:MAG: HAMP domain-containing protein [Deltaproteobacteria bacterium]|nr:HAMP domain-containing protein [Deltaproteobacteria bacterium]